MWLIFCLEFHPICFRLPLLLPPSSSPSVFFTPLLLSLPLLYLYLQWPGSQKSERSQWWREFALWTWKDESCLFPTSFPCIGLLVYFVRLFFRLVKNSFPDNLTVEDSADSVNSLQENKPHSVVGILYLLEQCCLLISLAICSLDENLGESMPTPCPGEGQPWKGFSRLTFFKPDTGKVLTNFSVNP